MDRHTVAGLGVPAATTTWDVVADRAEEVRAWFVQVRGGAPFLSAPDAKILADWLDAGVPVPRILRAVEAMAGWRRAKRLRGPFTLKSCARWLDAAGGAPELGAPELGARDAGADAAAPERAPSGAEVAEAGVTEALRAALAALYAEARAEVASVVGDDPEAVAAARCARARQFHEQAWALAAPVHDALVAEEAAALGDLAGLMDAEDFRRVCEEAARHRWRARFAALSIEAVLAGVEGDRGLA